MWLFLLQTLSKGDNLYEIYYNGKLVTATDAIEAGAFLKDNFCKTEKPLQKEIDKLKLKEKPLGGKGPLGKGEVIGKYIKRPFNPDKAGGKILNLSWKNAEITKEGIDIVKKHLSRFEEVPANKKMIARLEKIEAGEIPITDYDKRFYTHELREYERFVNLGHENTYWKNLPENLYENAHTATFEDYKIYELDSNRNSILYHPEVDQRIDFLDKEDLELMKLK